jgi:hypothetical protein
MPTPSPNRMVTRARRGAHLALRGISLATGTPLGGTRDEKRTRLCFLTRDVLFMRVEWATAQHLLFTVAATPTLNKT